MRARVKLTVEERISIALDLIRRERSLDEIREHYRVSHTTAYKIRNAFLEGGRRALGGVDKRGGDLEARVRALEKRVGTRDRPVHGQHNDQHNVSGRAAVPAGKIDSRVR